MTGSLVLAGGLLADGSGAEPRPADVVVADGRIVEVAEPGRGSGSRRRDVAGLLVAPGFVDIHTHSDLTRLAAPDAATRALQGITTEVIGNCGMSAAPVGDPLPEFRTVIGPIDVRPEVGIDWRTPAEYLDRAELTPGATNLVPLLGHGSLRHAVMGLDPAPATAAQRERMAAILDEALRAGYWGLSLGFMYAPGERSDAAELDALTAVLRAHDALLTSHLRAYDRDALVAAVDEAIGIARRGGVRLQISHLRSLSDDGTAIAAALARVEAAEVDLAADAYPYLAGHTTLLQLLPPELRGLGATDVLARLRAEPAAVAAALRAGTAHPPEAVTIAKAGDDPAIVGRTLAELAAARPDGDWAGVAVELLDRHDAGVDVIVVGSRQQDTDLVLRHPRVAVASDGVSLPLDHAANLPHPRSIGTFPRAFRSLADAGLGLGEIVRKMTALPAARLGLDRGRIAPGAVADLVVLDPAAIADRADYVHPLVPPAGVHDVLVAGRPVLRDGAPTGERPGTILRRGR